MSRVPQLPPLEVLKALGDNTRYAIYGELAVSRRPLATAELAERLGLHPNTVRPHLERMREVGLVELEIDARGEVGRPQHRYSVAQEMPLLGPAVTDGLSEMLAEVAMSAGASGADAYDVGRARGAAAAARRRTAPSCLEALVGTLDEMGFDPGVSAAADPDTALVDFAHCPYRPQAETHPELVCSLHRGMIEGFVDVMGDARVAEFCNLADRTPCRVAITAR